MLKDNKSRQFVTKLLKYGFIEATPENLKAYMDGFEMARRKSFEETGISAEEYIKMLTEDGTIPIHIITSREIVELDIMKLFFAVHRKDIIFCFQYNHKINP